MSRNVQLVLLCEDRQHEVFCRRFLKKAGWSTRRMRVEIAPSGRGSGEQFVRERFPTELSAYRSNRNILAEGLIVILDGDNRGVDERMKELDLECRRTGFSPRNEEDKGVAVLVPTWNIETWLAYLSGENVDETRSNYPRLNCERDCQSYVDVLYEMCLKNQLRQPSPPSLDAACEEYRIRLKQ